MSRRPVQASISNIADSATIVPVEERLLNAGRLSKGREAIRLKMANSIIEAPSKRHYN
jgi:hypothetical protein